MKIVVDVMGGDFPEKVIIGAAQSIKDHNYTIVLAGQKKLIQEVLDRKGLNNSRIEILDCSDFITNNDVPTDAIRNKTDSSMVQSFSLLHSDENVVGMISTGSTGALLAGAFMKIGRIRGISRPGLCPILTSITGNPVMVVDCGANVDCKPINLAHFAIMGNVYYQEVFGAESPRIGLLSNGSEDKKGNELTHEAFKLLKQLPINFVGNVEASAVLTGDVDVVVCDGFAGNVFLKSSEGAVKLVLKTLKQAIKSSMVSKIGALFMRGAFKTVKDKLEVSNAGGALLLGSRKIVVKAHGAGDEVAVRVAVSQIVKMHETGVCTKIEERIKTISFEDVGKCE